MKDGLVSVIIPTFNRSKTIERSIRSVLNQSYSNLEIIIIDDGSTDETKVVVENIQDARVKYHFQKNAGACAARNAGIALAKGTFIAFQDSDDYWYQDKLNLQLKNMHRNNADFDICRMECVNVTSNERNRQLVPSRRVSRQGLSLETILGTNFISTQMIVARRYVFDDNQFDTRLPRFQDWDLAIRLLQSFRLSYTPQVQVTQYLSSDSISKNPAKALKAYKILDIKYKSLLDIHSKAHASYLYGQACTCREVLSERERHNLFRRSLQLAFSAKTLIRYIQTSI